MLDRNKFLAQNIQTLGHLTTLYQPLRLFSLLRLQYDYAQRIRKGPTYLKVVRK